MLNEVKKQFDKEVKNNIIYSAKTKQYSVEAAIEEIKLLWADKPFKTILKPADVEEFIGKDVDKDINKDIEQNLRYEISKKIQPKFNDILAKKLKGLKDDHFRAKIENEIKQQMDDEINKLVQEALPNERRKAHAKKNYTSLIGFVYNAEYYYGANRKNLGDLNTSNLARISQVITTLQNEIDTLSYLKSVISIVAIYNYNDMIMNQQNKEFDAELLNYDVYATILDVTKFHNVKEFYDNYVVPYLQSGESNFIIDLQVAMEPDPEKTKMIQALRDKHNLFSVIPRVSLDRRSYEPYKNENGETKLSRTDFDNND